MRSPERLSPPFPRRALLTLAGIWLGWAVALSAFQALVPGRLALDHPDTMLDWTGSPIGPRSDHGRPDPADPTLAGHVAWDSWSYLSIAVAGYDDPDVAALEPADGSAPISVNYGFMPVYPGLMGLLAAPLAGLGLAPVAAAAFAGVAISLASTLAAMVALFALARRQLDDDGAIRAATYLLVFPSGFFLAQVYAEALFIALALGSLALLDARRPGPAAVLAVLAALTRPVGVALVIPFAIAALLRLRRDRATGLRARPLDLATWAVAVLAPLVACAGWLLSPFGARFLVVQREHFGREMLGQGPALEAWSGLVTGWGGLAPDTRMYYALEAGAVVLAIVASAWAFRRAPGLALFGLATIAIPLASGPPQSLVRFALAVPAIFLLLARLGGRQAFDRAWMIASTLAMGVLALLFTLDFWVA